MFPRPVPVPALRFSPLTALLVCALTTPVVAGAQSRRAPARDSIEIPESMTPPAGKCRIWMPGVPAAQQSAPTDCTTALRQRPANGVIVFGPAKRDLSPFDVRNPWGPAGTEATRRATARSDSVPATPAPRGRTPARTPAREPAASQIPPTRGAPASREAAPPARKDPPPPVKKPEKP